MLPNPTFVAYLFIELLHENKPLIVLKRLLSRSRQAYALISATARLQFYL